MTRSPLNQRVFEMLLAEIQQETGPNERKLDRLFRSKGNFSPNQASRVMYAFGQSLDRLKAMQIMDTRLCHMNCGEARDILNTLFINTDKLHVLQHIKRYLVDSEKAESKDLILSCFPFEGDKYRALAILGTVASYVAEQIPAGGHQRYAALGTNYSQAIPRNVHLFGSLEEQLQGVPGFGCRHFPIVAKAAINSSSLYSGHPSNAKPPGLRHEFDRKFLGNTNGDDVTENWECPVKTPKQAFSYYPSDGKPSMHQTCDAGAPTGFVTMQQ